MEIPLLDVQERSITNHTPSCNLLDAGRLKIVPTASGTGLKRRLKPALQTAAAVELC